MGSPEAVGAGPVLLGHQEQWGELGGGGEVGRAKSQMLEMRSGRERTNRTASKPFPP